jgi:hypothetical protein
MGRQWLFLYPFIGFYTKGHVGADGIANGKLSLSIIPTRTRLKSIDTQRI